MDSPSSGHGGSPDLQWQNVALALSFVAFNAALSYGLQLGVGSSLITAAARCVIQLTLVSYILERIFNTNHPAAVAGIALLLNVLAAFEIVANKCKMRYPRMFFVVLAAMTLSTIPVSIIGIRFAMSVNPFWKPEQYIPIVGMLCGSTISNLVVSLSFVLQELNENRDKTETYLAFGASRFEACKPIAKSALRLALTPTINQMSVLGIISIPGMMTGAILGGSSVIQAARLQMIIMFMLSASSALATIISIVCTLAICVDGQHRVRAERIDCRPFFLWRGAAIVGRALKSAASSACFGHRGKEKGTEREPLLGSP
ncbi:UPF0014-domain-containing protein [Peniophora sp. CONT]|nr:UPF0014-domain-containing protein [Peniophora sp. CONT]